MKISIVIPTINRPKKLNILLESLINQYNGNFEVLIIDQSKDRNNSTLFNKTYIKYFHNSHIKNLCDAKNYGVKFTNGEYLGFVDDDVELPKNFISRLFYSVEKLNPLILTGVEDGSFNKSYYIYILKKIFYRGIFYDNRILYKNKKYPDYIETNKIFGGCSFFKSIVFKNLSFRSKSPFFINEDTDFSLTVKDKFKDKFYIDTNLKYTHHGETKRFNQKYYDGNDLINKLSSNIVTSKLLFKFHKKSYIDNISLIWLLFGYFIVSIYLSFKYRKLRYLKISLDSLINEPKK